MAGREFIRSYGSVWLLVGLMVVVSAVTWAPNTGKQAYEVLKVSPDAVWSGQVWRLVTYAFIAPGSMWFFFTLLIFVYIAAPLEAAWGTRRFLALYLITTLGASVSAVLFRQEIAGGWAPMMSLMLIHGFLFPDSTIRLFFILPIRIKTLAIISAALYLATCMTHGLAGLALFLGTFTGVLYYVATTRSIPWVRRTRRRIVPAATDPASAVRGFSTGRIMERARQIMRQTDSGAALSDPDRGFIEELVQRADPTHELCSPYSFSPDNTICPPCQAFGRCLRRYLEAAPEDR
jgi:membrane associated rhomboid family serine protease